MTYTPEQKAARRAIKGVTPDTDLAGNPLTEAQKATMRETEARWAKEDAAKAHPLAALIGLNIEDVARVVYDAMRFERRDKTPEWVKGGNSNAQVEARATAARILAALEAAPVPDLVEAGKVLEGVTVQVWNADGCRVEAFRGKDQDGADYWEAVAECENEQDARFIAWCREGVPALIALASAQAAQIEAYRESHLHADKQLLHEKARAEAAEAKVAELEAKVAEVTSDRAYIIGANAGWEAAVEQGEATPAAAAMLAQLEAAEATAATLRAEVERLRGVVKAVLIDLRDGQCCPKGRAYGETYDTMMEVERNPTGAFMAIEAMDAAMDKAKDDLRAILRAMEEEGRDG